MRSRDRTRAAHLEDGFARFQSEIGLLPGIQDKVSQQTLIEQILESIRRVNYIMLLQQRKLSPLRQDPNSQMFDPLRAAILFKEQRKVDEAFWMVFFFVHFGKNIRGGWRYAREVYGRLGEESNWGWKEVCTSVKDFRKWLDANQHLLKRKGVPGGFGNHRKYQSLSAYKKNGTGDAVATYVGWIGPPFSHIRKLKSITESASGNATKAFDLVFHSVKAVRSFGRTACFDYAAMVGKLGLWPIEPGKPYIAGSTGPRMGACLLFDGHKDANTRSAEMDQKLVTLGRYLHIGMQVLEDALCNWQKSPTRFLPYRG